MSMTLDHAIARDAVRAVDGEDLFAMMGATMPFAREEEIFGQGEEAEFLYRVVKGAVRTTRLLSDGRRQIGAFYYPGDIFGLEPGGEHRFSAEALTDSVVQVVRRRRLRQGEDAAAFQRLIYDATALELERTQEHLLWLGRKSASERVASFLLDFADRAGSGSADLPMSRQDIADYLGLTIETVSRMVTHLQSIGAIELSGCRRLRVQDRNALARLGQ